MTASMRKGMTLTHTLPIEYLAAQVPALRPLSCCPFPRRQNTLVYLTVTAHLEVALVFITQGSSFLIDVAAVALLTGTQNVLQCRITISSRQIFHADTLIPVRGELRWALYILLRPLMTPRMRCFHWRKMHGSLWWKLSALM